MEQNIGLFSAKLEDLAEKAALMQRHIAELESADPDEVRRARAHLEAEWADVIVELKNRAKAMRFLTGQQLSVDPDFTRSRKQESGEHSDGGRFSGTIRSQKPKELACLNFQVQILDRQKMIVFFCQML